MKKTLEIAIIIGNVNKNYPYNRIIIMTGVAVSGNVISNSNLIS